MLYVTYLLDHMIYQVPMYVGERERERGADGRLQSAHKSFSNGCWLVRQLWKLARFLNAVFGVWAPDHLACCLPLPGSISSHKRGRNTCCACRWPCA